MQEVQISSKKNLFYKVVGRKGAKRKILAPLLTGEYMDREGVLRTFPVSNNLQEVQELKGVREDSPKKILLRIKLPKTEQSPEVIRHSSSRHPKLNQQKTF